MACFRRPHSSNCVFQKPLSHVHTHTVPLPPQHHPHIPDFYHLIHMQCQKMMFLVLSLTANFALVLYTIHITLVTSCVFMQYLNPAPHYCKSVTTFMKRRPILCTFHIAVDFFHIAVDFIIVPYKGLYGWGGGASM